MRQLSAVSMSSRWLPFLLGAASLAGCAEEVGCPDLAASSYALTLDDFSDDCVSEISHVVAAPPVLSGRHIVSQGTNMTHIELEQAGCSASMRIERYNIFERQLIVVEAPQLGGSTSNLTGAATVEHATLDDDFDLSKQSPGEAERTTLCKGSAHATLTPTSTN